MSDPWFPINELSIPVDVADTQDFSIEDPGNSVDAGDVATIAAARDNGVEAVQAQVQAIIANAQGQINALSDLFSASSIFNANISVSDINLSNAPNINWPQPDINDINNNLPSIDQPSFNADEPVPFQYTEDVYGSPLYNALVSKLINDIQESSSGIDPEVEQALYDRALNKLNAEFDIQQQITEDYFATKNFHLPAGALSGRLLELQKKHADSITDLLNDIIVQRSNLVQQNIQSLITGANNLEAVLRQTHDAVQNRELAKQQAIAQGSIDRYDAAIRKYLADVEKYQADVSVSIELIKSAIGIEDLKVRLADTHASVLLKQVDAWAKGESIKIDRAKVRSDEKIAQLQADVSGQIEQIRSQVEMIKAQASALAQIAAATISTVNTNMSYGYNTGISGSVSVSSSNSFGQSLSASQALSNSKSLSKSVGSSYNASFNRTQATNESVGSSHNWYYDET